MTLTPLSITAITNFVLAGESFFFAGLMMAAGKQRFLAAWSWQYAFIAYSISVLLSGIDHGFIQPLATGTLHKQVAYVSDAILGVMSFFVLLTIAHQFFQPGWHRYFYALGGIQFLLYLVFVLPTDAYWVVIANYAPAVILLMAFSVSNIRYGTGSWQLALGLALGITASAMQILQVKFSDLIDENSLYHIMLMFAVPLWYLGGIRLDKTKTARQTAL
ncbi:MAG: DUF6962 family protein [Methylobacter sp.]